MLNEEFPPKDIIKSKFVRGVKTFDGIVMVKNHFYAYITKPSHITIICTDYWYYKELEDILDVIREYHEDTSIEFQTQSRMYSYHPEGKPLIRQSRSS